MAWIELVAPLVGAWIEMISSVFGSPISGVAPLVGAWIEIIPDEARARLEAVASRGRVD